MKRKTLAQLAILISASTPLVATRAFAQQGQPPAALEQLGVFTGDWECAGQVFATADHPARVTTGHVHAGKVLDGYWVYLSYDETKTAANPHPAHIAQYFGYDAAARKFVFLAVDNYSGSGNVTKGSSPGWSGDSLAFDAATEMNGTRFAFRDTFMKNDRGELSHAGSAPDATGTWVTMDKETCHRLR